MIDKRMNYRYGGDTMGGRNDKSKGPSSRGPVDRSSAQQTANTRAAIAEARAANRATPMDVKEQYAVNTPVSINDIISGPDRSVADSAPQRTRDILEEFTSYRPEVNFPPYMIGANIFKPFIQKFSDISAAQNRSFFVDPNYQFGIGSLKFGPNKSVLEAGRYQLPGELGEKYGKFGYEDINAMTPQELDQAYKGYLKARSLGEIDAYGNPIMRGPGQDENPLVAQQTIPTVLPIQSSLPQDSSPTGGIAQYYDQLLRSFGLKV